MTGATRARSPARYALQAATALAAVVAAGASSGSGFGCAEWTPAAVPAPWPNRSDHAQVTLRNGSVLVMGGGDYATNWTVYNDVWRSDDAGSTWAPVTLRAPWAARAYLSLTAVYDRAFGPTGERLVVVGGGHCIGPFINSFCHAFEWFADVWVSDDGGATWQEAVANKTSPFAARGGHGAVALPAATRPQREPRPAPSHGASAASPSEARGAGASLRSTRLSPAAAGAPAALRDVLIFGGVNGVAAMNDAWRSADGGFTWSRVRANGTSNGFAEESGGGERGACRLRQWAAALPHGATSPPLLRDTALLAASRPAAAISSILVAGRSQTALGGRSPPAIDQDCSELSGAEPLPTFSFHNLLRWKGSLWAIAGASSAAYVNTVWSSSDGGATWRLAQPSAQWGIRILPATVVIPGGGAAGGNSTSLLIAGGSPQTGFSALRDVWRSDDGVTWTEVTPNATWPARGWQMATTVPADVEAAAALGRPATVVMTGGWTWNFPEQFSWTYYKDAWRCVAQP